MRYTIRRLGDIDLAVHGDTYEERKADVIEKAHAYMELKNSGVPIPIEQQLDWDGYWQEQGRQFGLLRTFKHDGIL